METIQNTLNIEAMFYILGACYFIMMMLGHFLLKKPDGWIEENKEEKFSPSIILKNKTFIGIWLMFFINIHCGLALISYEKQIIGVAFLGTAILPALISIVPSITAAFNTLGRIGFSTISDKMKDRNTVYKIIFISCIIITIVALLPSAIPNGSKSIFLEIIVVLLLIIVNAGYGGGFSTLPALLSSRFGMKQISRIHGLTLSAWAVAGLTGNNMSEIILKMTNMNYNYILGATLVFYIIALIICLTLVKNKKVNITNQN